jgi:hypothetical protein
MVGYNGNNIVNANVTTYSGNPQHKLDLTPHAEGVAEEGSVLRP